MYISFLLLCPPAAFVLYRFIIYPAFLSPLAKLPNVHFTSPYSDVWAFAQGRLGKKNRAIYEAHRRLGPIIRLSPDEVSVNCIQGGVKTIYSNFEKPDLSSFNHYGMPNMVSMSDNVSHTARRRALGDVLSKTTVQTSKEVLKISQVLLSRLTTVIEASIHDQQVVDFYGLSYAIGMDFISAYVFGLHNCVNWMQNLSACRRWMTVYFLSKSSRPWPIGSLKGMPWWQRALGAGYVPPSIVAADDESEAINLELIEAVRAAPREKARQHYTSPVVYNALSKSYASRDRDLSSTDLLRIASETMDHIVAGTDATAIVIIYAFHELSQRPDLQAALRKELSSIPSPLLHPIKDHIVDTALVRTIDRLPLLDAILMETLRLDSASPGAAPRIVPRGGTNLAGYDIPAGTQVAAQAYCLHRNEDVFPDPEAWRIDRWLNAEKEQREGMNSWFWPFGSGSRKCTGNHFAIQEIKFVLAAIYTNYVTSIVDDQGIEPVDALIAGPKGDKLVLKFEKAG